MGYGLLLCNKRLCLLVVLGMAPSGAVEQLVGGCLAANTRASPASSDQLAAAVMLLCWGSWASLIECKTIWPVWDGVGLGCLTQTDSDSEGASKVARSCLGYHLPEQQLAKHRNHSYDNDYDITSAFSNTELTSPVTHETVWTVWPQMHDRCTLLLTK